MSQADTLQRAQERIRRWRREQAPNISVMLAQAYASQLRFELTGSRKA